MASGIVRSMRLSIPFRGFTAAQNSAVLQQYRYSSSKVEPAEKAKAIIESVPANNFMSKAGTIFLGTGITAAAISQDLYWINDETLTVVCSLGLFAILGKMAGKPYTDWANAKIAEFKAIMQNARDGHAEAVNERLSSVSKLNEVEDITKGLFEMSKDTARMEAEAFELQQKVAVASEVKSVLDSWVRFETQVREAEQKDLSQTVIANVSKQLEDPKFQRSVLEDALANIEAMVKSKKI